MASSSCDMVGKAKKYDAAHIPVSFGDIYSVVKGSLSITQRSQFEEVRLLMESLNSQEFMTLRQNLKNNFRAFSLGAKNQTMQTRIGRGLPPKTDLDNREQVLVADFVQLMASARYHILTRDEWETALSEEFLFRLPVAINWNFFDSKLLGEFWHSNNERRNLYSLLPPMADRILIFHRGISIAHDSGRFIDGKLDLLVDYVILWPVLLLWAWIKSFLDLSRIKSFFVRKNKAVTPEDAAKVSEMTEAVTEGVSTSAASASAATAAAPGAEVAPKKSGRDKVAEVVDALVKKEGGDKTKAAGDKKKADEKEIVEESDDEDELGKVEKKLNYGARVVARKNLKRLLPNIRSVLWNFLTTLTIEEPSFKDVVVLYREAPAGRLNSKGRSKKELLTRDKEERLKDILSKRNIHIKCFHDIPMADIEAIFPDKKGRKGSREAKKDDGAVGVQGVNAPPGQSSKRWVYMKTLSIVNILVNVVSGLIAAFGAIYSSGTKIDINVIWSALSLVMARVGQLWSSVEAEKATMIQDMGWAEAMVGAGANAMVHDMVRDS
eukprot:gene7523-671_t